MPSPLDLAASLRARLSDPKHILLSKPVKTKTIRHSDIQSITRMSHYMYIIRVNGTDVYVSTVFDQSVDLSAPFTQLRMERCFEGVHYCISIDAP